jgi:5-methylcytosine-specific restriction endonuclease McrA
VTPRRKTLPEIQLLVRQRAGHLCEYCHTAELWQYVQFTVDHVIPLSRGGADTPDNLALACFHCNRKKADKLTAIDPETMLRLPYSIRGEMTGEIISSGLLMRLSLSA